jgi:hypothetical protein
MAKLLGKTHGINSLVRQNARLARYHWAGEFGSSHLPALARLTRQSGLSLALGEIHWLDGRWYVTHAGLLRVAKDSHCYGIETRAVSKFCDSAASRWVFKATVYKARGSQGFVGYGDADPSNVSPLVRGAEMRVAETRAVNRALRKAYGIGLCSVEELGYLSSPSQPATPKKAALPKSNGNGNGSGHGQPRLRDRLCLLIRQHQLDPSLVKRYAAEFCGTQEIRDASRDLVESFITHLAEWGAKDHAGLLSKLASYAQHSEVHS